MNITAANNQSIPVKLADIKNLVKYTLKKEGIKKADVEISVLLVDDEKIKELNKRHLRRHRPTDVISFRMWEGPFDKIHPEILGDVVVNVEQAKRSGKYFKWELSLYVVHGLLHLLGYIDDTKDNAAQMQKRCDKILEEWQWT